MKYEIGDEVYWIDPDDCSCSGHGTVIDKHGRGGKHRIYVLKMESGGETEAFEHELS